MVFDPNDAQRVQFLEWYRVQTEWREEHGYNDPAVPTPKLKSWFLEVIQTFPPLNGPLSTEELPEDEGAATDYSLGRSVIHCSFCWFKVDLHIGPYLNWPRSFFDVSSHDSRLWFPKNGKLARVG